MLNNLKKERRKKYNSCCTSRNSIGTMNINTLKSFGSIESSPVSRVNREDTISTPTNLTPFSSIQNREFRDSNLKKNKIRRDRNFRNKNKLVCQSNPFDLSKEKSMHHSRKSIESVTVYKGPHAKGYSINTSINVPSTTKNSQFMKSVSSFDYKFSSPKKFHKLDKSKNSLAFKKIKSFGTAKKAQPIKESSTQNDLTM